jgi:hypothetical protein
MQVLSPESRVGNEPKRLSSHRSGVGSIHAGGNDNNRLGVCDGVIVIVTGITINGFGESIDGPVIVGKFVASIVGCRVGEIVPTYMEGANVGCCCCVGSNVGMGVGIVVGISVGISVVGDAVGF